MVACWAMQAHENNRAFQLCDKFAITAYRVTETFPKREWYGGLAGQLRKSALSAASCIAEGSAKRGDAEYRRFLDMSMGSLTEAGYQLGFSYRIGFLDEEVFQAAYAEWAEASRVTWALYWTVVKRLENEERRRRKGNRNPE